MAHESGIVKPEDGISRAYDLIQNLGIPPTKTNVMLLAEIMLLLEDAYKKLTGVVPDEAKEASQSADGDNNE